MEGGRGSGLGAWGALCEGSRGKGDQQDGKEGRQSQSVRTWVEGVGEAGLGKWSRSDKGRGACAGQKMPKYGVFHPLAHAVTEAVKISKNLKIKGPIFRPDEPVV